ncbi:MAG: MmcQ/YjbR family DNA-binding protein [Bernardetiaceae bacterium]|nr:MmcQ/YjbR family DNA-binding protein [Bernardetiaceae bacterium]
MHIESYRNYCLSLPAVTEDMPFDDKILVFRVGGKIFTLTDLSNFDSFNVKCDPERAEELRARYSCVEAGYHMNKKHWNTIKLNADMDDAQLQAEIKHAYECVWNKLTQKMRKALSCSPNHQLRT